MNIDKTVGVGQVPLSASPAVPRSNPVIKVGTLLDVMVLARLGKNQYDLRGVNLRLSASSDQPLPVGTRQQLQVTGVRPDGSITATPVATTSQSGGALSAAILQRLASAATPQVLVQLVQQVGQQPGALAALYNQLLAILPKREQGLDAGTIRKWITQNAGLTSGLAQATGGNQNLKQLLSALLASTLNTANAEAVRPSSQGYTALSDELTEFFRIGLSTAASTAGGSLNQALQAALSRIESQQLLYLQARQDGFFQLLFDLPVIDQDRDHVWQGCIRRETAPNPSEQEDPANARWSVCLSAELEGLGLIAMRVELAPSQTGIDFYSTTNTVCERISTLLDSFSTRLKQLGLPSPHLSVCQGRLPEEYQPHLDIGHLEVIA